MTRLVFEEVSQRILFWCRLRRNLSAYGFFLACVLVGLVAQFIDGPLGMAYGVNCNTFLLTLGITPVFACASVKPAEVFTAAVSGIAHWKMGNVDRKFMFSMAVPGVVGGVAGAFVLSHFADNKFILPIVSVYLMGMGGFIIFKALRKKIDGPENAHRVVPLGLVGGFLDSIGGGGWGPVVTSTLIAGGKEVRIAIDSVNIAEFFVNLSQVLTFVLMLGPKMQEQSNQLLVIIGGLIVGGVIAAPVAAYVCKRIPPKKLMFVVGAAIIALSLRNIAVTF